MSAIPVVVLVACGAAKRAAPSQARELYTSVTFRLGRKVAERLAGPAFWFILSAKHGLIDPWRVLAPYNDRLPSGPAGATARAAWAARVMAELTSRFSALLPLRVIILGGRDYSGELSALMPGGWAVESPTAGLSVCKANARLAALARGGSR